MVTPTTIFVVQSYRIQKVRNGHTNYHIRRAVLWNTTGREWSHQLRYSLCSPMEYNRCGMLTPTTTSLCGPMEYNRCGIVTPTTIFVMQSYGTQQVRNGHKNHHIRCVVLWNTTGEDWSHNYQTRSAVLWNTTGGEWSQQLPYSSRSPMEYNR
jgi:hypothetical protein